MRTYRGGIVRLCHILLWALTLAGASIPFAPALEGPFDFGSITGAGAGDDSGGGLLGEGIDFRGGMLDWEEDENGNRIAILRNYAVVLLPGLTISARNMVLNVEMQEIYAEGEVVFEEAGGNAFYSDQLTFNYQEWKGLAKNVRIKIDREDVDLPIRDFLDIQPSTSISNTGSLNDAEDIDPYNRRPGAGTTLASGQLKRMYAQAAELRAHDQQTLELIDAKITPSGFARPHWYFHSPAALYRQKEKIESYHNTVRVGRWPILYFPYLIRDLQYDWPWMRIAAGRTSNYGYFVRSQWGWRFDENPDAYLRTDKIIVDLDFFSRRGLGVGLETTYKAGFLDSLGKLKVYGVWEFLTSKDRDNDRALDDNENRIYQNIPGYEPSLYRRDFRWAVDWEHYQELNEFWDLRAEAHLYHDRDYLKEYDPTRYWNAKEPENSISLRRQDRQWQFEIVASSRLSNHWETQSDYLPEARLTVPGMQVGDLPVYFKNDMRVGIVNRRFDEDQYKYTHWNTKDYWDYVTAGAGRPYPSSGLFAYDPITGRSTSRLNDKDNYGNMLRAFNEMRLEAPLKIGEIATLKPWVGLRTAYYSRTQGTLYGEAEILNDPYLKDFYDKGIYHPGMRREGGSGKFDYAVPFGMEASSRLYTLFGASDQWRLITEPVVSWTENSRSHLDALREIYPVDYYDRYHRDRRFGFELHTKLQRRYFDQSDSASVPERDILDFNVAFSEYPRRKDRLEANNNRRYTDLSTDLIYRPTEHLAISGSMDYDLDDNTANRAIVGVDWRINNYLRTYVTHFHYRGHYWAYPDQDQSEQTHLALRTKLWNDSSHYSLEGALAYEWRDSETWRTDEDGVRHGFNKYRITLFRDIDTMELALSYVRDRNADDHGVFFSLTPKGFMGYDSPPPAYSMEVEEVSDGRYSQAQRFLDDGYLIDGPVRDADIRDVQF